MMPKAEFIARQSRRPSGLLGYIVAWVMASETAQENNRTLDHLAIADGDRVLEIGCGHGTTLSKAAVCADNLKLTGIDFSDVMLRVARRRNSVLLAHNLLSLDHGDSAAPPYETRSFERIYSVHTIYFWVQPEVHLREISRVLAPGGRFVLGFRPSDDGAYAAKFPGSIYNMRAGAEVEALVATCGFASVQMHSQQINGHAMNWIVAHNDDT
jgi:SAM-dependent methyltransferase